MDIPKKGVIGFHPAELPKNRGRHPIIWALALGLESTASTFFKMDEGADSGEIVSQKLINISISDNAEDLYEKVATVSLKQIETFLPLLISDKVKLKKQDHKKTNYWRKRGKKDGLIDFRMGSRAIYNLVRALTAPYVGAHVLFENKEFKVWHVEEVFNVRNNIEPGKIIEINKQSSEIIVKCYDNAIKLVEHEIFEGVKVGQYFE